MTFSQYVESVEEYLPKFFEFLRKQPDDVFVHFTQWFRVGYNQKPSHTDPVGVYTFPKKYVLSMLGFAKNSHFFTMKNAFILKARSSKALNLSIITMPEVERLLKGMGIELNLEEKGKPGNILWHSIERSLEGKLGYGKKKNSQWNILFRKAGVDILVDEGDGIIHHNEPVQVVFLTPTSFQEIGHFEQGHPYRDLAIRIIKEIASKVFLQYRLSTHKRYSETTIYAHGQYKGKDTSIWGSYETRDFGGHELRMRINLSSHFAKENPSFGTDYDSPNQVQVSFDADKPDIEQQTTKIAELFKNKMDEPDFFRDDNSAQAKKLMDDVMKLLKLGGKPTKEREGYNYRKYFKRFGTLNINIRHSDYDNEYHLALAMKPSKSIPFSGSASTKEITEESARELLDKVLAYFKKSQQSIYPIDQDSYRNDDWNSHEKIEIGKFWLKFISMMRERIKPIQGELF